MLDKSFREKILKMYKKDDLLINEYARYVVDSTIMSRDKQHAEDKNYGYGFSPIGIICCVKNDGEVEKRFFEFNIINHFLKDYDGSSAIDVVKCILILWSKEDKSIKSFDYEVIDKELVRIDKEIEEKKKKDQQVNEVGKKIKEEIEPMMKMSSYESYEVASKEIPVKVKETLDKFKDKKEIFDYAISLSRNTKEVIGKNEMLVDIGYKLEEGAEFVVLACHIRPDKAISSQNGQN